MQDIYGIIYGEIQAPFEGSCREERTTEGVLLPLRFCVPPPMESLCQRIALVPLPLTKEAMMGGLGILAMCILGRFRS